MSKISEREKIMKLLHSSLLDCDTQVSIAEKGEEIFEYDKQGFFIKPKWKMVSSHTARRTAITNMYLSGKYTTLQMMHVSGHKKEKTFYNYIKLSLEELADNVASASFDSLF